MYEYMVIYTYKDGSNVGVASESIKCNGLIDAKFWKSLEVRLNDQNGYQGVVITNIIPLPILPAGPAEMDV